MSNWDYIVLGSCFLLLAFLLWMEWRRPDRARLFWRSAAAVVAVGALACLGLPMYYWRETARPAPVVGKRQSVDSVRGVVAIDWRRKLNRGDSLFVKGNWAGAPVKLLLMGMGSVLDSVKPGAGGEFLLSAVPSQVGRAVYGLVAVEGKDTMAREEIPIEVGAGKPLKILMLAASPDFENRFLMKWLGGDGHTVASRTMVSRGKVQEAFVNRGPVSLTTLGPALLANFDLVIADAAALPVRGSVEWMALRREMGERGMGLVVKVDSSGLDSMVRVMRGRPSRVLVRDSLGHVVAGALLEVMGKVVFTALPASYARLLAGQKAEYAAYWSKLLREGRKEAAEEWNWEPALPRVGDEVRLRLQTAEAFPQGVIGATVVYLIQDPQLAFLWRGKYWPEKAGWLPLGRPMGDTSFCYVWPAGAWKGILKEQEGKDAERVERMRVEFPKGWFACLFLLSMVFLWVERKMGGMSG